MSPVDEHEIEILEIVGVDDERLKPKRKPKRAGGKPTAGTVVTERELRARMLLERGRKEGRGDILRELLPELDSLEKCIREARDDESRAEGVRLALRGLWDVFRRHELERIEGDGLPFDPEIHEAVETQASERVAPGTVLKVIRVGYKLGDQLVRPAMVRVSVAPGQDDASAREEGR